MGSAIRRSVPIRTFSDWHDPAPGFFEVDMVEHCGGPKQDGNFVHSLVLTDIATGSTECVALPLRNQALVVQGIAKVRAEIPFAMRGIDTDNDSAFMNQTVLDYCTAHDLVLTRSRAYKKNDQAWVEQKNGAIVRRLVGYGRLSGMAATQTLAELYCASRLYINFFQPSFKLKSKHREGARVSKTYHPPRTPCERLLALPEVSAATKAMLRRQQHELDPVQLLHDIRAGQRALAESFSQRDTAASTQSINSGNVTTFLDGLATAWQQGEVRATHRQAPRPPRWWRTRTDPFEQAWPLIDHWLTVEPTLTAREIMTRLSAAMPVAYPDMSSLRTLQRRLQDWRLVQANALVLGQMSKTHNHGVGAAAPTP